MNFTKQATSEQTHEALKALSQVRGSRTYYYHQTGIKFTDGVLYLAVHSKCEWLIDVIASYQSDALRHPELREPQRWVLTVHADSTALLECRSEEGKTVIDQAINQTNFPLPRIEILVMDRAMFLPSEY